MECGEVDLNSKVLGMSDLLGATLGGTIQLRTMLAADLWPALVDPTQIELVTLNKADFGETQLTLQRPVPLVPAVLHFREGFGGRPQWGLVRVVPRATNRPLVGGVRL